MKIEKIKIRTGSHYLNKKALSEINDILLSKKNPLFKKFNTEDFYLDDCDEFISIVKSSYYVKDITEKQFIKFIDFIKKYVTSDGDKLHLFFGSLIAKI